MADLVNSMVSYAHGLCLKLGLVGLWLCFSVRVIFYCDNIDEVYSPLRQYNTV